MKIMHAVTEHLSHLPAGLWYALGALVATMMLLALLKYQIWRKGIQAEIEEFHLECDKMVGKTDHFYYVLRGRGPGVHRLWASVRFSKEMIVWLEYSRYATDDDKMLAHCLETYLRKQGYSCHIDGPLEPPAPKKPEAPAPVPS